MRSIEPQMRNCASGNLEILRCASAHHSSRFACPGMTGRETHGSTPAARSARVLRSRCPPSNRGRRESRALTAPAVPCAKVVKESTRVELQVQPRHPGFPRAMVLPLIRALPGEAAFLAPVVRETPAGSARVAAPGPHDFAVRGFPSSGVRILISFEIKPLRLRSPRPSPPAPNVP
jgi:hypothetical protein